MPSDLPVVLRVEDVVGPEGLGDVFVEVGGERQLRVHVVHQTPRVRLVHEDGVIILCRQTDIQRQYGTRGTEKHA